MYQGSGDAVGLGANQARTVLSSSIVQGPELPNQYPSNEVKLSTLTSLPHRLERTVSPTEQPVVSTGAAVPALGVLPGVTADRTGGAWLTEHPSVCTLTPISEWLHAMLQE